MSILMVANDTLNRTLELFWDNTYNLAFGHELILAVVFMAFILILILRSKTGYIVGSALIMLTLLLSDLFPPVWKAGVLIGGGVIWYLALKKLVL